MNNIYINFSKVIVVTAVGSYFAKKYYNRNNKLINNYLINFQYSLIYNFSKLQIIFKNIKKYIIEKTITNTNNNNNNKWIELIKNYETKSKIIFNSIINNYYYDFNKLEIDFIILNDNVDEIVNKLIFFKNPDILCYNKCNYRFLNIDMIFEDKNVYTIKLHSENENYYIENNIINKISLCYLLKKQHGVYKDFHSVKYTLDIYDHEVKNIILNETKLIFLNRDNYEIQHFVYPFKSPPPDNYYLIEEKEKKEEEEEEENEENEEKEEEEENEENEEKEEEEENEEKEEEEEEEENEEKEEKEEEEENEEKEENVEKEENDEEENEEKEVNAEKEEEEVNDEKNKEEEEFYYEIEEYGENVETEYDENNKTEYYDKPYINYEEEVKQYYIFNLNLNNLLNYKKTI
jgi:DNA segregation ATPase FtsK/SpoIIIE-like protein